MNLLTLDKNSVQSKCAPLLRDEDVTAESMAEITGEETLRFWRRPNGQIVIFIYGIDDVIIIDGVMVHVTRSLRCENCGDEDGVMSRDSNGEIWCSLCLDDDNYFADELDDLTEIPMFDGL